MKYSSYYNSPSEYGIAETHGQYAVNGPYFDTYGEAKKELVKLAKAHAEQAKKAIKEIRSSKKGRL
jgi:ribosome recycling factor